MLSGRGGGRTSASQCGPLYCRCFPLRAQNEHLTSISNWQSLSLVPNYDIMEANYMSDLILKIIVPVQLFPISTTLKMCVYFCRAKRCPYFFAQVFPSFCITSVFSEGQLNLFDRGTAEHLLKHSLFFFPSFQTSTAAACRAFAE